jgi:hypothetical protein
MLSKIKTGTLIGLLVVSVIGLSGCAGFQKKIDGPCGVDGYIETEAGTVITGVALPTDEKKTYNVVTPKKGAWFSQECFDRIK